MCSLLANALENAINSCIKQCDNAVSKDNKRLITIKLFEKNNKICINIANTYFKEPRFHNQIPVTDEPDHGIGVRSIISVIEKYNGIYAFLPKTVHSIFRLVYKNGDCTHSPHLLYYCINYYQL